MATYNRSLCKLHDSKIYMHHINSYFQRGLESTASVLTVISIQIIQMSINQAKTH